MGKIQVEVTINAVPVVPNHVFIVQDSSAINLVVYDFTKLGARAGDLILSFVSGGVYTFRGVPSDVVLKLLQSESIGAEYHNIIKGRFITTRIDNIG